MITQYEEPGTIPAQVLETFKAKIGLFDQYVAFRTAEYEYTLIVKHINGEIKCYRASRQTTSGWSNYYTMVELEGQDFRTTISNELYVYSNIGKGQMLPLPVYEGVGAIALATFWAALIITIVFRGCLQIWRKSR